MSKLLFSIGQTFEKQIEIVNEAHIFEGCMYEGSDGTIFMFCQIAYSTFAFINLEDGNRYNEGVVLRSPNYPELHGCNDRGVLRKMNREMDQRLIYIGILPNIYKRGTI